MALLIETLSEQMYRLGRSATFIGSNAAFPSEGIANIVLCTGDKPVDLKSIGLVSTSQQMTWEAFKSPDYVVGSGAPITPIIRNPIPSVKRQFNVEVNPTLNSDGTALFQNPAIIIGQQGAGNRNYIDELLVDELFKFDANTCYLIRLTNDIEASPTRYSLTMNVYLSEQ